jgi:hypothetical protein
LLKHDVVAARQSGRRLRIHCVDTTKEPPLIGRDLDQCAVLTCERSAQCRDFDAAAGESAFDRAFRQELMSGR